MYKVCITLSYCNDFTVKFHVQQCLSYFTGQYGIARKFYFPFQKSYWCGVPSTKVEGRAYMSNTPDVELGNNG